MKSFRIRNVLCDFYLAETNSLDRLKYGADADAKLPVLRMFGITDDGDKCCVHIHGYLPSIVFRVGAQVLPQHEQFYASVICRIASILNDKGALRNDPANAIYHMSKEKGRSMYGYYPEEEYFLRVYLFDPDLTRLCILALQKECLANERLQPYNSHVPFVLQFFIDYQLFGMDFVHFSQLYLRSGSVSGFQPVHRSPLRPSASVPLEFDVFTDHILNPWQSSGGFHSPGLDFIWQEERGRHDQLGMRLEEVPPVVDVPEDEQRDLPPQETSPRDAEYRHRLSEALAKLSAKMSSDVASGKQPPGVDYGAPSHISPDSVPGIESSPQSPRGPSPMGLAEEEVPEGSDPMWENRTLQLMGFKVEDGDDEEEVLAGQSAPTAIPPEDDFITIGDEEEGGGDAPHDVIQIDSDDDDEDEDPLKFKCEAVEPDAPPVRLAPVQSQEELLCQSEIPPHLQPGSEERHQETWLGDETIADLPSQLDISTPLKKLTRDADAEKERQLMRCTNSYVDHFCVLSLEVLTLPTDERRIVPEPELDPVLGVFFSLDCDVCNAEPHQGNMHKGAILLDRLKDVFPLKNFIYRDSELALYEELERCVQRFDPDVLIGYDTTRFSWGYLFERATFLGHSFLSGISRIRGSKALHGRIMLQGWRSVRSETAMKGYSFSSAVMTILGKRVPCFPVSSMRRMLDSIEPGMRATLFRHLLCRAVMCLEILKRLDVFVRISQMARALDRRDDSYSVIGIQFKEVISRGSQYRVESMLLRLAKRLRYFAPSISPEQRELMDSPETIPLNLEPESSLYRDPVVVLDFTSLYPSVVIAYNYCFSTCLGKVSNWEAAAGAAEDATVTLGALKYHPSSLRAIVDLLESGAIHISPTGGIFVKEGVRRSLLATLLQELLDTRIMVKKAMKVHKDCPNLLRLLAARQLALKLVANVTYGYTAANWSGRMPCEEVADAIIAKARETLERAIQMVKCQGQEKYSGARVIYGDTDSLFILFKGCSMANAFELGYKIVEGVGELNPPSVKLKFEKVMLPCALLTKKRYVGISYETIGQVVGVLESKGIETVRRDVCPFVSETMERVLNVLFYRGVDTALRCLREKLAEMTKLPLSSFVISTEYRGEYAEDALLPINKIARDLARISKRLQPVRGERVRYLVMDPGMGQAANLTSCVVTVEQFLSSTSNRPHYNYYVSRKLFPVLQRVFQLASVHLRWSPSSFAFCLGCGFDELPQWCNDCVGDERTLRHALLRIKTMAKMSGSLRQTCSDCVAPMKSIGDGAEAEMWECENFECPVKQRLIGITKRRSVETDALKHHLAFSSVRKHV